MRLNAFTTRFALASLIVVILSIAAVAELAWQQTRSEVIERLDEFTAEIARRSAAARQQELELVEHLRALPDGPPCSAERQERLRLESVPYSYIEGAGELDGTRLLCTSLIALNAPLELGEPQRRSPDGQISWHGIEIPGVPGVRFKVDGRHGFAIFMISQEVIDVLPNGSPLSVAHISTAARPWTRIRQLGPYGFDSLLGEERVLDHWFWRDDNFITTRVIPSPPALSLAAMPQAQFQQLFHQRLMLLGLPAALIAGLLIGLIGVLLRHFMSLKAALARAIRQRQFNMVYQPVIELATGRCVGAEALLRWQRPDGRHMGPAQFIPEAERCGLIHQITAQVLEMVSQEAGELMRIHPEAHIAVNLSAGDLADADTLACLGRLLDDTALEACNVIVEVTESGLLKPEVAQGMLVAIRARGFRVAIDDFGTGHSSLSYLATYELDYLKIDKKFVDNLEGDVDAASRKLAFHIIGIARSLGLQMIAEGVETETQMRILRDAGVQYAQGWLFAKPMGMRQLIEFVRREPRHLPARSSSSSPLEL